MKRLVTYFAVVGLVSAALSFFYYSRLFALEQKKGSYLNKTFHYALDSNDYNDALFVGSSRVWVHIDPDRISAQTGLKAWNLACDGSGLPEHDALIRAYLRKHPAPRYIFLNLDFLCFDVYHETYNFPEYIPYLYDTIVSKALTPYNPRFRSSLKKKLYLLKWLSSVPDEDKFSALVHPAYFDIDFYPGYKGFLPVDRHWDKEADEKLKIRKKAVFPLQGQKIFSELAALCRQKNIMLVGLMAPVYERYSEVVTNAGWMTKNIYGICRKENVPLWDFSTILYTQKQYYYNSTHLNAAGARIYTDSLIQRMNSRLTGR